MKKIKLECRCKICGKLAPIDKEKSNENWIVYDTKSKCECGGNYGMTISEDNEEGDKE